MLTPKSEHTEFEDDPGGNVEPVQSRGDNVRHVAPPREHKNEACRGPHNTGQLIEKVFGNSAEESVAIV